MGTRLYPVTTNPAILERLADVPAGTHAKLQAIEDEKEQRKAELTRLYEEGKVPEPEVFWKFEEIAAETYDKMREDDDVSCLDHFITFGWGSFDYEDDCYGQTTDLDKVKEYLSQQGVDLNGVQIEDLEGVCWS